MKKKQVFSNILAWTKDVGLKAFAVLALVIGGIYVVAADINYPAPGPNAVTGVVGMFVAPSTCTFNDAIAPCPNVTNYTEANALCASTAGDALDSHVCTTDEMINSYNHSDGNLAGMTGKLYINNGPPGYLASSNDCGGWNRKDAGTDSKYPNYGSVWDFDSHMGFITICTKGLNFACCK